MKIPESVHDGLKLASGVSACAGGFIAVVTAAVGAVKSFKSRQKIAGLIVGEILNRHPNITSADVNSVVISELKSSDYWKMLDYGEKGMVTEMVTKLLLKSSRKEEIAC